MMNIMLLAMEKDHNRMVEYPNEITAAGELRALRKSWGSLVQIGLNYGYFPQTAKAWVIVKEEKLEEALHIFEAKDI